MKKIFTLICALVGLVATAMADSIKDLPVCKHSAVFVMDVYTNNGSVGLDANKIYDGYLFSNSATGKATNKGSVDLSDDPKYSEYGSHLNCVKLKDSKQGLVLKVTAGSKVIVYHQSHASRYIDIQEVDEKNYTAKETKTLFKGEVNSTKTEWVADDDRTIRIGSIAGDLYVSYIIVEANEAAGTPQVKVGPQTYDETKGLWYCDVTVKPMKVQEEGEEFESIVKYTTDGSTPNENSEQVPADPIRCYKDMVLKFQAYGDFMGDGSLDEEFICKGAENEAIVSFSFDGPKIKSEKGVVTVTSPYEGQGATNFIEYGEQKVEGNTTTLTESAVVSAYTTIKNGDYATFTSKKTTADVYVLDPIKTTQEITISGNAVKDEEATAADPNGNIVYKVENGSVNADNKLFFVRNATLKALSNLDPTVAKYQVPAGKEAYLQMTGDNITFLVAENDSVDVTVTCTKNSCKNLDKENEKKIYINVDGKTYGCDDITAGDPDNLDGYLNVVKFRLGAGYHTFKKYSGTGNIMVSSIKFEPVINDGISNVTVADTAKVKKVVENGQIVIVNGNNKYNVAGAHIK